MTDDVRVELRQLPVALHRASSEHIDGLIREFQLLGTDPTDAPTRMVTVGRRLQNRSRAVTDVINAAVAEAARRGEPSVDVTIDVPVEAGDVCRSVDALLDEADQFCRDGGLLTLAMPPHASAFRRWFFGEFCRQITGAAPTPWPESPQAAELAEDTSSTTG